MRSYFLLSQLYSFGSAQKYYEDETGVIRQAPNCAPAGWKDKEGFGCQYYVWDCDSDASIFEDLSNEYFYDGLYPVRYDGRSCKECGCEEEEETTTTTTTTTPFTTTTTTDASDDEPVDEPKCLGDDDYPTGGTRICRDYEGHICKNNAIVYGYEEAVIDEGAEKCPQCGCSSTDDASDDEPVDEPKCLGDDDYPTPGVRKCREYEGHYCKNNAMVYGYEEDVIDEGAEKCPQCGCSSTDDETTKCPSETCWTEESDGSCTFDPDNCPKLSVTCNAEDGMSINFPRDLFDSDDGTIFNVGYSSPDLSSNCQPRDNGAGEAVTWKSELGNCGISVSKTADNIVFEQIISVGGEVGGQQITDANQEDITIYMTESSSVSRVTFTCTFPLTASVQSDDVTVTQAVNDGVIEYAGNWENAFEIQFTQSDYRTPTDSRMKNTIGRVLYAVVNFNFWNVPVRWYVKECSVIGSRELVIVKNSCYSEFVGAGFGGNDEGDLTNKLATWQSRFQYKSFSFGKGPTEIQRLRCAITFCLEEDDRSECKVEDLICPSSEKDNIFGYSAYGFGSSFMLK